MILFDMSGTHLQLHSRISVKWASSQSQCTNVAAIHASEYLRSGETPCLKVLRSRLEQHETEAEKTRNRTSRNGCGASFEREALFRLLDLVNL